MSQSSERNTAFTLVIAILSMVAFWIGLISAGLILGFLSSHQPHHEIQVIKYVAPPSGAATALAPGEASALHDSDTHASLH